jgi:hypothetical protein
MTMKVKISLERIAELRKELARVQRVLADDERWIRQTELEKVKAREVLLGDFEVGDRIEENTDIRVWNHDEDTDTPNEFVK